MSTKIAMICPYFGRVPPYFDLWALSAGYNDFIDFKILADWTYDKPLPDNIQIIPFTFEEAQRRIKYHFGEKAKINRPYKLCDYRPTFGIVFADFFEGYDFWGYCDVDLIFGDCRRYLPESVLQTVNKCYRHGHFTLYRNTDEINALYQKHVPGYCTCNDVFATNYSCHFDESSFLADDKLTGIHTHFGWHFSDVPAFSGNFTRLNYSSAYTRAFRWKDGRLTVFEECDGEITQSETMYAHFQKRGMVDETTTPADGFVIIPDKFVDDTEITVAFLEASTLVNDDQKFKKMKRQIRMDNFKNGGLLWKLHRFKVADGC